MILRAFLISLSLLLLQPQAHAVNSCAALFRSDILFGELTFAPELKPQILKAALSETKIKLTSDQEYINSILEKWQLHQSTPYKVEQIAQALLIKLDHKRTFIDWLKELVFKADPNKEALRVRSETLVLTRELLRALEIRGFVKKNTKLDDYRTFRQTHFNKVQLAKFLAVNSMIMGTVTALSGVPFLIPLYYPAREGFNWIRNLDIKNEDIDLVQKKGFEAAYPTIRQKYKMQLRVHTTVERAPQILFLSAVTYLGYNYLSFKAEESVQQTHYQTTTEQVTILNPKLFEDWKSEFEKENGRAPDMNNAQDRREWEILSNSLYQAWADVFKAEQGRPPDLSKEQDRQSWENFVSSLQ